MFKLRIVYLVRTGRFLDRCEPCTNQTRHHR